MNRWKKLLSMAMVAMLVVLAGCQSIAGVDISKVLVKNVTATSGESNLSLAFELVPEDGAKMTGKQQAMLELLKSMKLTLDSIKMQDSTHFSAKGSLDVKSVKIPLQLAMDDQSITLHIDGAKKPIRLNLFALAGQGQGSLPAGTLEQLAGLQSKVQEIAPDLIAFFVKHFPDIENISLDKVKETVHGESLDLNKLHVELNGKELLSLLKQLLVNISEDKEGMQELIGSLLDTLLPVIEEVMKSDPSMQSYTELLKNKEVVAAFLVPLITDILDKAIADFDSVEADLDILKGFSLKLDLYIDSNLDIRKTNAEMSATIPKGATDEPVKGFVVRVTSEQWNIGKPVKADTIDTSAGVLDAQNMQIGKFVANFDKNSAFYKLLKEDLNVTKMNLKMILAENMEDAAMGTGKPYKKNGDTSMVPTRYLAEGLGAEVKWTDATKQITVIDYLTDKTIVMHVGSNKAFVNGVEKQMPEAVETVGNWSFVPVRFIATEVGFDVEWNEESQIVSIVRD